MDDLISRQYAIDALWKALYSYEDKTEKQFIESEDLDIQDWMLHRVFVQNMSDIDRKTILDLPPAQPEHLTDDDFETIRIHLSAFKEKLCNQHRWKEAEEYQHIIDRIMAFASAKPEITEAQVKEYCEKRCLVVLSSDAFHRLKSAQPERKRGQWLGKPIAGYCTVRCSVCKNVFRENNGRWNFCPNCGAEMEYKNER